MKYDAFIGGSYESQAVTADAERTVNWFPELLESPGATAKAVLYPTPGVVALSTVSKGNGRAHFALNGREFAVIGSTFYEINSEGIASSRGSVAVDGNPATISSNGDGGGQLFITSGRNGYIYNLSTNQLSQVSALNGKASQGGHLDGYFLALDATTATLYISNLLDGLVWDTGEDFAQRSIAPDRWVALKVVGRFLWLFGERTSEVWYDTGATFPFEPHPSGLVQFGIAAPYSISILGDDVIWLAQTASGRRSVVRARGFTPQVISTRPLETKLASYTGVSVAVSDCYSEAGHSFYLLSFDKDDATWAYDDATQMWSERGTWISDDHKFTAWRPRHYAWAFNQHRMLDAGGGSIYEMGLQYTTDVGGLYVRRLRRAPAIMNENRRVFYSSFELDLEPGLGIHRSKASFTMAASALSSLDFSWLQTSESASVSFSFNLENEHLGTGSTATVTWDWGDGTSNSYTATGYDIGTYTKAHTYSIPPDDTFTVTLTVSSDLFAGTGSTDMTTDYTNGQSGSTV